MKKQKTPKIKKAIKRKVAKKKTVKKKESPPPKKKTGYNDKTGLVIETLIACGMNLEMVCGALKIRRQTLWNWRRDHPELETAIEDGRLKRADRGEDVLFDMAEPHDEVVVKVKEGEETEIETTTKKNVVSERLLLKMLEANKPEKYGKKVELGHKFTFGDLAKMALGDDEK